MVMIWIHIYIPGVFWEWWSDVQCNRQVCHRPQGWFLLETKRSRYDMCNWSLIRDHASYWLERYNYEVWSVKCYTFASFAAPIFTSSHWSVNWTEFTFINLEWYFPLTLHATRWYVSALVVTPPWRHVLWPKRPYERRNVVFIRANVDGILWRQANAKAAQAS